jgi:hypothetical protein
MIKHGNQESSAHSASPIRETKAHVYVEYNTSLIGIHRSQNLVRLSLLLSPAKLLRKI